MMKPSEWQELALRNDGWRLATAEVLYYMPDHPSLLQSFVWQTLDLAPDFPRIQQFLGYWRREIEAVISTVRIATERGDIHMNGMKYLSLDAQRIGGTETGFETGGTETGIRLLTRLM